VDAEEVRRVLTQTAGVDDALVFATANAGGDDILVALVASRDGVDADAVRLHCLEHLAAFKVPERLLMVTALPVNSIGKPRIEVARQMVENQMGGSAC
jgi:long-chain acyl-CoA synthetase